MSDDVNYNSDNRTSQHSHSSYTKEEIMLGAAAVAYATAGVKVFPLQKHDKTPVTSKEYGLLHGHLDATSDPRIVRAWWAVFRGANIGIPGNDEFFILDVDTYSGGGQTLEAICANNSDLPDTPSVETGGGGKHYYFAQPEGTRKIGTKNGFLHGLDAKGIGGYVVAPPSIHPDGPLYVWEDDESIISSEMAQAPAWLLNILPTAPPAGFHHRISYSEWANMTRPISEGDGRHSTLLSLAGKLVPQIGARAARQLLIAWNQQLCNPPLEEHDFNRVLFYVYKKEKSAHV